MAKVNENKVMEFNLTGEEKEVLKNAKAIIDREWSELLSEDADTAYEVGRLLFNTKVSMGKVIESIDIK